MDLSMYLVIPAAGKGSRFVEAGYTTPKPLLPLKDGTPMIAGVVRDCLLAFPDIKAVIIGAPSEYITSVMKAVSVWHGMVRVVAFDEVTRGAAETVLRLIEGLPDAPVVIANSDQAFSSLDVKPRLRPNAGVCLTFGPDDSTKWSFLVDGTIVEKPDVAPVNGVKTIGVYAWGSVARLRADIASMIAENERHGPNQEFYLAPVMNRLDAIINLPVESFTALGTPEDYEAAQ